MTWKERYFSCLLAVYYIFPLNKTEENKKAKNAMFPKTKKKKKKKDEEHLSVNRRSNGSHLIIRLHSLDTSDGLTGFSRKSSAPSSKHLKITKQHQHYYKNFQHHEKDKNTLDDPQNYLLILFGTFSDDMITTGISLNSDDPCSTMANS